jgi:hypothetical protein
MFISHNVMHYIEEHEGDRKKRIDERSRVGRYICAPHIVGISPYKIYRSYSHHEWMNMIKCKDGER